MFEDYIRANADAWQKLGFGITWKAKVEDRGPDCANFAVTDWHGEVFVDRKEEEDELDDSESYQIGRVHLSLVNSNRVEDWLDTLDCTNRLAEFKPVYCPEGPGRALCKLLEGFVTRDVPNVLLLHSLEILPEFRKRGFGFAVLTQMLNRFEPGTGYALLSAAPMDKTSRWTPETDFDRAMKPRIVEGYDVIAKKRVPG